MNELILFHCPTRPEKRTVFASVGFIQFQEILFAGPASDIIFLHFADARRGTGLAAMFVVTIYAEFLVSLNLNFFCHELIVRTGFFSVNPGVFALWFIDFLTNHLI
jgi:hypothetical protein